LVKICFTQSAVAGIYQEKKSNNGEKESSGSIARGRMPQYKIHSRKLNLGLLKKKDQMLNQEE